MALLNHGDISKIEREEYRSIIFTGIVQSFLCLLKLMDELGLVLDNSKNEVRYYANYRSDAFN